MREYIQTWMQDIYVNSKCINYRIFVYFDFEVHLIQLPDNLKITGSFDQIVILSRHISTRTAKGDRHSAVTSLRTRCIGSVLFYCWANIEPAGLSCPGWHHHRVAVYNYIHILYLITCKSS